MQSCPEGSINGTYRVSGREEFYSGQPPTADPASEIAQTVYDLRGEMIGRPLRPHIDLSYAVPKCL
jgi:hypothetical protein